jgi:glycosyltransferase involved in cell wall biosynthesis
MKKMSILLAIGSSEIGGGQKVFLTQIKEFIKRDYSLVVVLPEGPLVQLVQSYRVKTCIVNFNSMAALLSIAKIMKQEQVDIVNTYLTKCSLLFSLVNIIYRLPLCCTLLNAITHEKLGRYRKFIYPSLYLLLHKLCNGIIVNSEQNKRHFIEVAGIDAKDIKVIYSGIDVDEFTNAQENRPKSDKFVIGAVGRLSLEKGHIYLMKALTHLRKIDFECLIVGDGPLRSELENYVTNENLTRNVIFLGFKKNVAEIMAQMDIVVMPSLNETFGITIVEAFALKKLVIASDVGGIPELVNHKITGLLFPVKNSVALAEAIEYAFNNKEEMEKMSNNAYEFAMKNFTSAAMADNTLRYYDSILCRT